MGTRPGQDLHADGTPAEARTLRRRHLTARTQLMAWMFKTGELLGMQAGGLTSSTSSHVAGLCAWSVWDQLGGQFCLIQIQPRSWLENVCLIFLFRLFLPPFLFS